nr:MAG TPA: hypothetical protein [Podoviridae sp. ctY3D12]
MDLYKQKIQKYLNNPEYCDPNCSLQQAQVILNRLSREYHFNYKTNKISNGNNNR